MPGASVSWLCKTTRLARRSRHDERLQHNTNQRSTTAPSWFVLGTEGRNPDTARAPPFDRRTGTGLGRICEKRRVTETPEALSRLQATATCYHHNASPHIRKQHRKSASALYQMPCDAYVQHAQ